MSEFLVEVTRQNAGIARSLRSLRRRAETAVRSAEIADTVLDARDSARSNVAQGAEAGERSTASGGRAGGGSSQALMASGESPFRTLRALDTTTITPLLELEALAMRSLKILSRRRTRQRVVLFGGGGLIGLQIGLAAILIGLGHGLVGAILIVLAVIIAGATHVTWKPIERASRTQRLTGLAEEMASDIRSRVASLEQIHDLNTRQLEQWKNVLELTEGLAAT